MERGRKYAKWIGFRAGPVVFAFFYCLVYGRLGLNALDSPIVLDGAWRLMNGQEFFVDFITPAGFTPIVFQQFFHSLFGVNWFSLCLHAALFNALFVALVGDWLRRAGLGTMGAAFYAVLSGIVFYAPFGTAYPDQHAFFFSFLAVYFLYRAGRANGSLAWLIGVAPALLLAGLSKQVPSAYIALGIVLVLPFWFSWRHWGKMLGWLALGLLLGGGWVATWFDWGAMDLELARYYLWELPQQEGNARLAELGYGPMKTLRAVAFRSYQSVVDGPIVYHHLMYQVPWLGALVWGVLRWRQGRFSSTAGLGAWLRPWILAWLLSIGSGAFVLLTFNQAENGVPFLFVATGLLHAGWLQWRDLLDDRWRFIPGLTVLVVALLIAQSLYVITDFHSEAVVARKVHDFPAGTAPANSWPDGTDDLKWLAWAEPWVGQDREPTELIAWLRSEDQPFFFMGDFSAVYALTGQVSPWPSLWLHPGLTLPPLGSPEFDAYDAELEAGLVRQAPAYAVFPPGETATYKDLELRDFPRTAAWLEQRKTEVQDIGGYRVWGLN